MCRDCKAVNIKSAYLKEPRELNRLCISTCWVNINYSNEPDMTTCLLHVKRFLLTLTTYLFVRLLASGVETILIIRIKK